MSFFSGWLLYISIIFRILVVEKLDNRVKMQLKKKRNHYIELNQLLN